MPCLSGRRLQHPTASLSVVAMARVPLSIHTSLSLGPASLSRLKRWPQALTSCVPVGGVLRRPGRLPCPAPVRGVGGCLETACPSERLYDLPAVMVSSVFVLSSRLLAICDDLPEKPEGPMGGGVIHSRTRGAGEAHETLIASQSALPE